MSVNSYSFIIILLFLFNVTAGCRNSNGDLSSLAAERDSLKTLTQRQAEDLSNINRTIEVFNATIDSITAHDKLIFVNDGETPLTKEDVRHNLSRFRDLLKNQGEKIRKLESRLATQNDSISGVLRTIAHLKEQIAMKNSQISELQADLENRNVTIQQLREKVNAQQTTINTQSETINTLSLRNRQQSDALARQDAMLNNGYVLIGSKDDLKRKGITKKGNLISEAILDRSKFFKVDIRKWREISFDAKKPKILTNMPASSFELTTTDKKNFTLMVKNPTDFWSISNYLIIQTD